MELIISVSTFYVDSVLDLIFAIIHVSQWHPTCTFSHAVSTHELKFVTVYSVYNGQVKSIGYAHQMYLLQRKNKGMASYSILLLWNFL